MIHEIHGAHSLYGARSSWTTQHSLSWSTLSVNHTIHSSSQSTLSVDHTTAPIMEHALRGLHYSPYHGARSLWTTLYIHYTPYHGALYPWSSRVPNTRCVPPLSLKDTKDVSATTLLPFSFYVIAHIYNQYNTNTQPIPCRCIQDTNTTCTWYGVKTHVVLTR